MISRLLPLLGAVTIGAGFVATVPAAAQAQPAVHAETGLPFCSATVKDRCVQRVDLVREGKSTAKK